MNLVINTLAQEYKNFHDAVIESVYYDVNNKLIEITLDALNFYYEGESKREKLKVVFENVKNVKITEVFSWDFIQEAVFEKVDEQYSYFATAKESPLFSVVYEKMIVQKI